MVKSVSERDFKNDKDSADMTSWLELYGGWEVQTELQIQT